MTKSGLNRVLITGGASGLGRAMALRFARDGRRVAIADVNEERMIEAAQAVEAAGGEALTIQCDITSDEDARAAGETIRDAWGGLDVLVNNAGVASAGTVVDTSLDDWRWMIDINLLGAVRMCQAFVPMMKQQCAGHVINVASVAGIAQSPGMASYNVAKAGIIALSETLSNELKGYDVGVTVVCPSFFVTNLLESFRGPETGAKDKATRWMQRSNLTADDIAESAVRAMEKGELFAFGHFEAGLTYHFKRLLPGVFHWSTGRAARRMFGDIVDLGPDDTQAGK